MAKISVLVVDDSALMRQVLTELLDSDPEVEVVGSAPDPYVARQMIKTLNPDVLTLDVEMPRMDGLAFLEKIMTLRPMPVLMVSSLTEKGAEVTLRALELGAVDYVAKPKIGVVQGLTDARAELIEKVKTAACARVRPLKRSTARSTAKASKPVAGSRTLGSETVVAIGSSTGGVEALRELLVDLPANAPAILVVQHMPENFTTSFATRLNGLCQMAVGEAKDGGRVLPGHVYIAPGNRHLVLERSGANFLCRLRDDPLVSGHRPSVDVLFRSVAAAAAKNAVGVILTGMGRDGAQGLLEMRQAGAHTIGQDEASCVVYGMPRAAKDEGAVVKELSLSHIGEEILQACERRSAARL